MRSFCQKPPRKAPARRPETQQRLDSIMAYIKDYRAKHQYQPSIREMGQHFHMSTSVIRYFLVMLENDGRILRPGGKVARSLIILEK